MVVAARDAARTAAMSQSVRLANRSRHAGSAARAAPAGKT